jgi:hypothetical protein
MPDTIHGYPVIASVLTPKAEMTRAGRVVLVHRKDRIYDPYVVAWQGEGDNEWCHGDYCDSLQNAFERFVKRAARYLQLSITVKEG